jgi:hypothetical protein
LKKGFVLTIDYGYPSKELYAPHRKEGTLLCYYRHRASENPYERLGEQDITSHVNFTSLIQKGEEVGLHLTGAPEGESSAVYSFCEDVGLPTTFADIGVQEAGRARLLEAAKRFGADSAIKAGNDVPSLLRKANNGRPADYVVVCAGNPVTGERITMKKIAVGSDIDAYCQNYRV